MTMKLYELAFASYIYNVSNAFNGTYEEFLFKTNNLASLRLSLGLVAINSDGNS
jgi:hypothetical protein